MLRIRAKQNDALASSLIDQFVAAKLHGMHGETPTWAAGLTAEEIEGELRKLVARAHKAEIFAPASISRLVSLRDNYNFALPLSEYHAYLLDRPDFPEGYRLDALERSLQSRESLVRIGLETDVSRVRGSNG